MSASATAVELAVFEPDRFEQHRRELTGYCYRMLGSSFEAEDAVQETMIRAWRAQDAFEGRSSVRTWLHRVATNVCLDMLRSRKRRALPMGLVPVSTADVADIGPKLHESMWVLPVPDDRVLSDHADPAQVAAQRDSVRLAFLAALQHLPGRQRAVLLLRDVLGWSAAEVAELLDATVASVNSALQRARATLAAHDPGAATQPDDATRRELLAEFMDAFERYDVARITRMLHDDAIQSMPPYALWISGADEIARWMTGPGAGCEGSRVIPVAANGTIAFAQYRRGGAEPWAIQTLWLDGRRIRQIHTFLLPEQLFPLFGVPMSL
ncbi:MAG TPA: sigma-70 family RNA polymerase sigma factor [Actinocrinis sp.]|uniref:sigma-70 family RNA polymerase sigma factor n=1 Tax=Actinocrinis sp. TaxID=1920516 RepID=UPI002DDD368B|nr:sigma-70 family RNA polymerase sigma factor [Actinocrinis sp.]HEV2346863.1 sigma-70 family RNA polymerase sigma factor [Actinocrinis sp.]